MNKLLITFNVLFSVVLILIFAAILKKKNIIQSYTARKLVHISVGTIALFFLKDYGNDEDSIIWASVPTFIFAIVFYIMGSIKDNNIVTHFFTSSTCRSGESSEMKRGPCIYCVIMTILIYKYYIYYPPSIIGLACLVFGDGFGEIIGRKYQSKTIISPLGNTKTINGCLAVFISGFIGSLIFCYHIFGNFFLWKCLIGSLFGMITEFLSPTGWDNLFIPLPYIIFDSLIGNKYI